MGKKKTLILIVFVCFSNSLFFTSLSFTNLSFAGDLRKTKKTLSIHMIDVGQGEAILIDLFGRKQILIDTGPQESFYGKNGKKKCCYSGNGKFKAFIKTFPIIHQLILTHPHSDHIGSLAWLIQRSAQRYTSQESSSQRFSIGEILDVGLVPSSETLEYYAHCLKLIEEKKIPYRIARKGLSYWIEGVHFEFLSPSLILPFQSDRDNWLNNHSLVLKVRYKNTSFLFTADIGKNIEKQLIDSEKTKLHATILKSAHQGSKDSNSLEWIHKVNPKAVIISAGKGNSHKHPHSETLSRYKKENIPVFRTDQHGIISIHSNGEAYKIETQWNLNKKKAKKNF